MGSSFTHLDYVVLIVANLERSVQFYQQVLGLTLKHQAEEYAQFETGTTRLGLYTRDALARILGEPLRSPSRVAPGFEIGFKVEDVDSAYTRLVELGALPAAAPQDRPWNQRTAYLRDPDNHLIELAQDSG